MTFTAKNNHGETSRPFKLVVGDKLALTPPTGWNSWGGQMINVSDAVMRKAADLMVERGLADVGFQYVGIDDCWMRLSQEMYDQRREVDREETLRLRSHRHQHHRPHPRRGGQHPAEWEIPGHEGHDGLHPQPWSEGRHLQQPGSQDLPGMVGFLRPRMRRRRPVCEMGL